MIKVHFKFSGMDTFAVESESVDFGGVLEELTGLKPDLNIENYDFFSVEKGDNIDRSTRILNEQHVHAYPKVSKIKNGMDRKSLYSWIKENDLASKFKEEFNKPYTNSLTAELEEFYNSQNNTNNEAEVENEVKCDCESSEKDVYNALVDVSVQLCSIACLFNEMVTALANIAEKTLKGKKSNEEKDEKENKTKAKIVPSDWSPVD